MMNGWLALQSILKLGFEVRISGNENTKLYVVDVYVISGELGQDKELLLSSSNAIVDTALIEAYHAAVEVS